MLTCAKHKLYHQANPKLLLDFDSGIKKNEGMNDAQTRQRLHGQLISPALVPVPALSTFSALCVKASMLQLCITRAISCSTHSYPPTHFICHVFKKSIDSHHLLIIISFMLCLVLLIYSLYYSD